MVRIWAALAMALMVGAGCGDSESESQSQTAVANTEPALHAAEPATEAGLYAGAREAEQQGQADLAIRLYRRILSEYPQSADNYKAVFLIGFVFSEKLNQPDSARLMFETVIREYPECEFVDDAEAMLRFLKGELPPFEDAPHS